MEYPAKGTGGHGSGLQAAAHSQMNQKLLEETRSRKNLSLFLKALYNFKQLSY